MFAELGNDDEDENGCREKRQQFAASANGKVTPVGGEVEDAIARVESWA
jgi:hypothetical protein